MPATYHAFFLTALTLLMAVMAVIMSFMPNHGIHEKSSHSC
jgi:hypothetical protein